MLNEEMNMFSWN